MARRAVRSKKSVGGKATSGGSRFHRGSEGRQMSVQERERQAKRREEIESGNRVFRFFVPVGETKEIVILDEEPDFFMWEHNYQGSDGHYGHLAGCCKEYETCPACENTDSDSYYAMFLTVLDLSGYTDKNGNEVEFTRKLLCVKPTQQSKFMRAVEKRGTLRGAVFEMSRDGKKSSAIGNDIEFQEMMSEDDLATYVREWEDRDGKVHEEDCSVPYEYEEIFDEPTPENIAKQLGIDYEPTAGSAESNRKALDDEAYEEDEEEETPRRRGPARRGRAASKKTASRRRAVDDEGESEEDSTPWDEEEEEDKEEAPPRRRAVTKKAGRRRR